jgi:hypothetical protein
MINIVDLHTPHRPRLDGPYIDDITPPGALRIVTRPFLVHDLLTGQVEDLVGSREVDQVIRRGLRTPATNRFGGHRASIAKAQHEFPYIVGEPARRHRELNRAGARHSAIRIENARQELPPLSLRRSEIVDGDVLVSENTDRSKYGLHRAVALVTRPAET